MLFLIIMNLTTNKDALGLNAQTDSIIECVGAATTLLVEQIQKKRY